MAEQKSFRESRIAITALQATPFSEGNTMPNYFVLVNNSAGYVYVGVSPNVSPSVFETIIPPYGTRSYGRPDAPMELWLYATVDTSLYIASMEREFEPGMIAQTQEIASVNASGLLGTVNVNAILEPLPAGTNALGTVAITSMPDIAGDVEVTGEVEVTALPALPAGTNSIGAVTTDAVKPATTPALYNVEMTNADTEYSQALPANCKRFRLSMRENDTAFRIAYETGKVATPTAPYWASAAGAVIEIDALNLTSKTIYFGCASAGKNIQIEAWS